ncbi:HDOD domain-containing protein [Shewanella avicenniae]|uniref:HDOD domain-containing protein n=1 Tax=Shewanella avicenniae TaxID=2814294 RepID=A0ABX7QNZ9_9GAMM|nr:HDOD domain-containing protein [Shewanella avicenniae]QSX33183.1 HDOD domain-containing protein [Shewanella avicenniae]
MEPLTVLFVDDDPLVLKALQRAARRIRPEWRIYLSTEPTQWQASCKQPVDIVVCDYVMPGIRGNELLKQVREKMPSAIRVLLTGDTSPAVLESLYHCSHFMIGKPYKEQDLVYLFSCAERLKLLPFTAAERQILGCLQELPAMPQLLIQFKRILNDPELDIEDLAELISQDSVLSGKLLQYANSAFFGFGRKTTSIFEAIMRLGSKLTEAIIISMLVDTTLSCRLPEEQLRCINESALAHARLSRHIAEYLDLPADHVDELFAAAMLSGLGRLIVATQQYCEEHARLQNATASSTALVLTAEHSLLSLENSALVSAYMLTLWGYPAEFCTMVLKQDMPADESQPNGLKQFILFLGKRWLVANSTKRKELLSMIHLPELQQALLLSDKAK